jgi:hypothetical protein
LLPACIINTILPAKVMFQFPGPAAGDPSSCWQLNSVKTAVNNMKTNACTNPTNNSKK